MTQASVNIAQQFKDGGVVPADLAGQNAASKKYVDDQLAIRDKNITAAQTDIDNHLQSTSAHPAQNITYSGEVTGAGNVKQALDMTDKRIDNIVAQAGNDNTEIVDARGGYPVLGDRLNATDAQLADFVSVKNLGAKGDGSDESELIKSIIDANKGKRIYFSKGTYNVSNMAPVDGLVHLFGEGTIIGFKYSESNPPQYGYRDTTSANDAYFIAEGLTFQGTGDTPGLTIYNAPKTVNRSFRLENCVFRGKYGLLTQNCAHSVMTVCEFVQNQYGWTSKSCSNISAGDCNFYASYGAGLKITTSDDAIFGHGGENIKLYNCLFFDSVAGIICEKHNYLWLDNVLMDYVNLGIYLLGSRGCYITDSYIGFGQGDRSDMPLYVAPPAFGCVYGVPDLNSTRTTGVEATNSEFQGYADARSDIFVLDALSAVLGIEQTEITNCKFEADPASDFDYLLRISGNALNINHSNNIYVAPNNGNLIAPYTIPNIDTLMNERNNIQECYRTGGAKIPVSFGYVGNEKFESASLILTTNGTATTAANNYVFKNKYSSFPRVIATAKIGTAAYPSHKLNVGVSGADTVQAFFQATHIDGTNMTAGQEITIDVFIIGQ